MLTDNHIKGIKWEISFLKIIEKVFGVPVSEVLYCMCDTEDDKKLFDDGFKDCDEKPILVFNNEEQYKGTDIMLNSISMDLKITDSKYERVYCVLHKINGKYTYEKTDDTHILIFVVKNVIYAVPATLIELIVNRMYIGKDFSDSYYLDKTKFEEKGMIKNGKFAFCISPQIFQDCLREYISCYCQNSNMRYLLHNFKPFEDTENLFH